MRNSSYRFKETTVVCACVCVSNNNKITKDAKQSCDNQNYNQNQNCEDTNTKRWVCGTSSEVVTLTSGDSGI